MCRPGARSCFRSHPFTSCSGKSPCPFRRWRQDLRVAGRQSVVVRDRGRLCSRWEVSDAVAGKQREYCYVLWQKETPRVSAAGERCAQLQSGAALLVLVSGIAYSCGRLSGSALAPRFGVAGRRSVVVRGNGRRCSRCGVRAVPGRCERYCGALMPRASAKGNVATACGK